MSRFLILLYMLLCSSFPVAMGMKVQNAFAAEAVQNTDAKRNCTGTFWTGWQKVSLFSQQPGLVVPNPETALAPQSDSPESEGQQNRQTPIRLKKVLRIGKAMPIPGVVPYFIQTHAHSIPRLGTYAGSTCLLALYCTFRI